MKQVGNKITILYCQLKLSVLFWDILLIHRIRNISCIFLPLRDLILGCRFYCGLHVSGNDKQDGRHPWQGILLDFASLV